MPILIKKSQKPASSLQLIAPPSDMGLVDSSVLEDVGFLNEEPVGKFVQKVKFKEGQRVQVSLPPYPWTTIWKLGDVGTVKRVWEAVREYKLLGEGYGVVAVEMDVVRHSDWNVIYFAERNLELVL